MGRMRLQSTMQRLASLAVFARSQALTIGRPVAMEVNQSAQEVTLLQQAEGQAEGFTPLGAQWRLRMPESVSMSALEIDGASAQTAGAGQTASPLKSSESPEGRITFYPDGSAQAGCVTLALRSEGGQAGAKRLCVNKVTGRVRVQ